MHTTKIEGTYEVTRNERGQVVGFRQVAPTSPSSASTLIRRAAPLSASAPTPAAPAMPAAPPLRRAPDSAGHELAEEVLLVAAGHVDDNKTSDLATEAARLAATNEN